ncbi:two-component sensor histidine kinase [Sphaerisporangium rufum]|uniref:histidine kinase n=1 Tax=Sphaerisporangium rufum TaxID=1381558 RepID=A0A919V1M9_9ACTN|nr:two-component sensor histidine kinase [Sphaerisporangium rufum]
MRPSAGVVDAGIAAAVTAVIAVAVTADVGGRSAPPVAAYLFAVGCGALMLLRRRLPVAMLLVTATGLMVYYAAGLPPIGLAVPVAGALFSAAEAGRQWWAAGVATAMLALSGYFRLAEGDDPAYLFGLELTSELGLMVAMIALGDGLRSRRLLRAEMRHREARAAAEREEIAMRRMQEERLGIARELHDVLAHTVTVISLQASVGAEALPGDPVAARSSLEAIRQAGDEAMGELRATLGLLRRDAGAPTPEPPAGAAGLAALDRLIAATGALPVTLRVSGRPAPLPHVVDATAYRVVQEALTNTLRHAGATRAWIDLDYRAGLRITVTDDGRGGDPAAAGAGHGLRGMAERVELLGGMMHAGPRQGGGFQVQVTLPTAAPAGGSAGRTAALR